MPLVPTPKRCDPSVKKAIQILTQKLGLRSNPTFTSLTLDTLTLSKICTVAAGLNVLRVTGLQTDSVAMTGTLRGAYIDVSNGSTAATGTIRAMELKARTEAPGDTGNDVNVLEGLSISADSKGHGVTTMRAAEFILDGSAGGTIDEAVGLRIANNLQADKATISYGLQIYRDSFDYTADIQLSSGGLIGGSTGALQINTDDQVTINKTSATYPFLINSTDASNQTSIYHDNFNTNFKTNNGAFIFTSDEGTNHHTYLYIQGKGTGIGFLNVYDQDNEEYVHFRASSGVGFLSVLGTTPVSLRLQSEADIPILMFRGSTEGQTQELKIYGFRTGDGVVRKSLEIGVGVDAADTASFDGLSNYLFDGNVLATSFNSLYLQYTATGNIAIGDATTLDALDTNPEHNIAIGNGAGSGITDGDNNIFIGYRAGYTTTIAGSCIAIGYEALYGGTSRSSTVAIGYQAMRYHNGGNGNTIIGHQAGLGDVGGAAYTYNVFIGEGAGTFCNDGGSNVIVGRQAGHHISDGTNNIFIGQMAGHTQVDNSNLLIVDNQERADVATDITNAILYGVMAATPAAQSLRINAEILGSDGAKIGDGGATNYTHIDSGGRLLLVGTAQTWEDIRIVPGAFQFPGVADPTLQSWQPGGAGTTYKVYKFLKNDEVHFTCQIPHNYKEGSDIKPHLHWTPCDRGNEEDGNTVGWKIDYSWANTDAAYPSSTTVDLSNACSGIDDQHELTDSGTITGTNKTISGVLQIRLYRSDTDGDDTWVGATSALSPAILEFDLHYEVDSLGSDLELVKDTP